jgi:septum formation protein
MALWQSEDSLVLGSRSVARRMLLAAAGIPIEVVSAELDERAIEAKAPVSTPGEVAALLARCKAGAVAQVRPGRLVVGADQTLALGQERFSKPSDRAGAREQLLALAGRRHELYSAVVVVRDGAVLFEHVGVAQLTMRAFSTEFLELYLAAAGPAVQSSVGGYQLEGIGVQLFDRVEGDYFTIMGLPLVPLLSYLRREGSLLA